MYILRMVFSTIVAYLFFWVPILAHTFYGEAIGIGLLAVYLVCWGVALIFGIICWHAVKEHIKQERIHGGDQYDS